MDNSYLTYQKFNDKEEALELAELLTDNKIEFLLEDTSDSFDPSFANNSFNQEFRVKLKKQDFEYVDKLLLSIYEKHLDEIDKDYYLFKFSDEKLLRILTESDKWSRFDYLLAQKILKERGQEVSEKLLGTLRKQRIEELAKPEDSQKTWIMAGYLSAFLGGFLGLFIGWHLRSHKKVLPNGDSIYAYSNEDRKHGSRILILGIISLVLWAIVQILIVV